MSSPKSSTNPKDEKRENSEGAKATSTMEIDTSEQSLENSASNTSKSAGRKKSKMVIEEDDDSSDETLGAIVAEVKGTTAKQATNTTAAVNNKRTLPAEAAHANEPPAKRAKTEAQTTAPASKAAPAKVPPADSKKRKLSTPSNETDQRPAKKSRPSPPNSASPAKTVDKKPPQRVKTEPKVEVKKEKEQESEEASGAGDDDEEDEEDREVVELKEEEEDEDHADSVNLNSDVESKPEPGLVKSEQTEASEQGEAEGDDEDGDDAGEDGAEDGSDGGDEEEEEEKEEKKKPPSKNSKTKTARKVKKEEESEDGEDGDDGDDDHEEEEEYEDDDDGSDEVESSKTPRKRTPAKKTPSKKTPTKKASTKKTPTKKTPSKKTPTKKATTPKGKAKKETPDDEKPKRKKKEEEEPAGRKWWEEDSDWRKGAKKNWKWQSLSHKGVYFPPPYVPHGIKMLYDGEEVDLTPEQEEPVTYFVRYLETDHMNKPQFSKNFFEDWRGDFLGKHHKIKDFKKCDFSPILKYVKEQQEQRKNRSKEEKEKEKKEKAEIKARHGFAIVDGHKEAIGNFTVEPPGLFLGRGNHPKAGKIKKRVTPEQVTLNLDEKTKPPPCPVEGHKWGAISHNHEVTWLAAWRENINNQQKYVLFSAQSSIRGRSDRKKFETAKRLKKHVKKIRKNYMADLKSDDEAVRQRATALWVIDHLALRVGNDKGDDQADTVGCCSLRFEHIKLHEPKTIEFDFLGKDSMPYRNKVEVIPLVYSNFARFLKGKKEGDEVFDRLSPPQLNAHLQSLMKGLTAKVFRTYNASNTMQDELEKYDPKKFKNASVEEKVLFFNRASVQVAVLCNHQRTVPKTHSTQMEKLDRLIQETEEEIKEIKAHIKRLKAGKEPLARKKGEDGEPLKAFPVNVDSCERKIKALEERIRKTKVKVQEKDDAKEVSTSTSKVNYIDPRVSIAWCEKNGVDIKKIFSKTMRDKFAWAIEEIKQKPDFVF